MKTFVKQFKRLARKNGQALLLVMIVAMISLAVVIGVFERTNRQLTVERQNAEYKLAFDKVLGATDTLQSLINNGDIQDPYSATEINAKLQDPSNQLIPCTDPSAAVNNSNPPCEYKISVDNFDPSSTSPYQMVSDTSLFITPFDKTSPTPVASFAIWCDQSPTNSSISVQPIYQTGTTPNIKYNIDNINIDCTSNFDSTNVATDSTSGAIKGGPDWSVNKTEKYIASTGTAGNQYSVKTLGVDSLLNPYKHVNGNYLRMLFRVPASKQNIVGIRVIPKTGYANNSNTNTSFTLVMYDTYSDALDGKKLGTNNPLMGTATGYAKNGRTSTIKFTIQNNVQMPAFFNYVAFEGT